MVSKVPSTRVLSGDSADDAHLLGEGQLNKAWYMRGKEAGPRRNVCRRSWSCFRCCMTAGLLLAATALCVPLLPCNGSGLLICKVRTFVGCGMPTGWQLLRDILAAPPGAATRTPCRAAPLNGTRARACLLPRLAGSVREFRLLKASEVPGPAVPEEFLQSCRSKRLRLCLGCGVVVARVARVARSRTRARKRETWEASSDG